MSSIEMCSRCKANAAPTDEFCSSCGLRLGANEQHFSQMKFQPLPPGNEVRYRTRQKPWFRQNLRNLSLAVIVLVVAYASFGMWRAGAAPAYQIASEESGITIMLMGVDEAEGDEIDVGVRPDSLSVLHLDPTTGSCRVLGIPRDSRVEVPEVGLTKVNHALSIGGIPLQRSVVEGYLGITIDNFALVDFQGLSGVVDALGGITVINDHAFSLGDDHFPEGEIELDGRTALRFSRYRGGPDGDFGRINRQQLVMRGILNELREANPLQTVPRLMTAIEGHFRTDLTIPEMISLATQFQGTCTTETLETRTLAGENAMYLDPLLGQSLWYVEVSPAEVVNGVRWLLTGE